MVQHNYLQATPFTIDHMSHCREYLSDSKDVFVRELRLLGRFTFANDKFLWEIYLARLVKYQEAWHWAVRQREKVLLESQSKSHMVGQPIRTAADLRR